ncbi:MAG: DMT family transporter [Pseudomonadota bacterium]
MSARNPSRGIALSIIAMLCLAGVDATGKHLVQTYPIVEIMAIRFAIFFSIVMATNVFSGRIPRFHSSVAFTQITRSLVLAAEVAVFIFSFSLMPLADVHAIAAIAPLIALVMAGVYLGETIGRRSWASVAIGLLGALLIIRPGMGVMSWYALAPICGAILWAWYQILSRQVAAFDSAETTVLYTALIGLAVFGLLAPFDWVTPNSADWGLLALNGALGALGHYLLIRALVYAPASVLQPFGYTLLIWAILIGCLVFGDWPDAMTLIGAAVVVGAGIYASRPVQQA